MNENVTLIPAKKRPGSRAAKAGKSQNLESQRIAK